MTVDYGVVAWFLAGRGNASIVGQCALVPETALFILGLRRTKWLARTSTGDHVQDPGFLEGRTSQPALAGFDAVQMQHVPLCSAAFT